jgi:hypothetical protein
MSLEDASRARRMFLDRPIELSYTAYETASVLIANDSQFLGHGARTLK